MNPWQLLKNLPFELESWLIGRWNERFDRHPSSKPFPSGDEFRRLCSYLLDPDQEKGDPEQGGLLFVHGHLVPRFWANVRPRVRKRFVLITHNSDWSIGNEARSWLDDPSLVRWFGQNATISHPKLVPVPIGLENARRHSAGVVADFKRLRRFPPGKRHPGIIYGFSLATNFEERIRCLRALRAHPLAKAFPQPLNARLYRKELATYRFVASPEGNGPDCHRTWEALLLGVIPIVTRSCLTQRFFDLGLPLLIVDSWDQLCKWDQHALDAFYEEKEKLLNHPVLLWDYWEREVHATLELL
jgi:hypothetical protein